MTGLATNNSQAEAHEPILGAYFGNGSQTAIAAQFSKGKPTMFGLLSMICVAVALFSAFTLIAFYRLLGVDSERALDYITAVSLGVGLLVFALGTLGIFILDYNYFMARWRYKATVNEARYWNGNYDLRLQCVPPRSPGDFQALVYAAERADRAHALRYVAETMESDYRTAIHVRRIKDKALPAGELQRMILSVAETPVVAPPAPDAVRGHMPGDPYHDDPDYDPESPAYGDSEEG